MGVKLKFQFCEPNEGHVFTPEKVTNKTPLKNLKRSTWTPVAYLPQGTRTQGLSAKPVSCKRKKKEFVVHQINLKQQWAWYTLDLYEFI